MTLVWLLTCAVGQTTSAGLELARPITATTTPQRIWPGEDLVVTLDIEAIAAQAVTFELDSSMQLGGLPIIDSALTVRRNDLNRQKATFVLTLDSSALRPADHKLPRLSLTLRTPSGPAQPLRLQTPQVPFTVLDPTWRVIGWTALISVVLALVLSGATLALINRRRRRPLREGGLAETLWAEAQTVWLTYERSPRSVSGVLQNLSRLRKLALRHTAPDSDLLAQAVPLLIRRWRRWSDYEFRLPPHILTSFKADVLELCHQMRVAAAHKTSPSPPRPH